MEKSIHSTSYAVFLKVLKKAREDAGLTQAQLAQRIGETQTFISKCERGERRVDVVELRTFCHAFDLSLEAFVAKLERAMSKVKRS
jgi:transcriptional regulator with XRE-family HTH domain